MKTKEDIQNHFIRRIELERLTHLNNIFPEFHAALYELVNKGILNLENGYLSIHK